MTKKRVDQALVDRGLVESRSLAQRLVMAGKVWISGERVNKSSQMVTDQDELIVESSPRFVSRGGDKLEAGLSRFEIDLNGKVCADVGASTGGFTDCILQHGGSKVYAVDVGHGVLHWKLRNDQRVVVLERTNARDLESLPEEVAFVSIDVSFISLRHILPRVAHWLNDDGDLIALIKPQFEAGRGSVGKGGVVRDPEIHRQVCETVVGYARENSLVDWGLIRSPLLGPKGNQEFLLWCRKGLDVPVHRILPEEW